MSGLDALATIHATGEPTDLRAYFEGRWSLLRQIEDRCRGLTGTLLGEARFEGHAKGLSYREAGRMRLSPLYLRIVDVCEELVKFTLLTRGRSAYLTDRYSERVESAEAVSRRVNQKTH